MKYENTEEINVAINTLRGALWRVIDRLSSHGYDGDWQQAQDIELVSRLSGVVHSYKQSPHRVSDESVKRLGMLSFGEISSVLNRKTRAITESDKSVKPDKSFSQEQIDDIIRSMSVVIFDGE